MYLKFLNESQFEIDRYSESYNPESDYMKYSITISIEGKTNLYDSIIDMFNVNYKKGDTFYIVNGLEQIEFSNFSLQSISRQVGRDNSSINITFIK